MVIVPFVLQLVGLACLLIAALGLFPNTRIGWGWFGIFLWLLSRMASGFTLHPA